MPSHNQLWFPAQISPGLKGGRLHRLLIDDGGLSVTTIAGFYGNRESTPVLKIPREALIEVRYIGRTVRGDRCRLRYIDAANNERHLQFVAINPDTTANYSITALAAQVLESVRSGQAIADPIHFDYGLAPVRPIVKLLFVPISLAILIILPAMAKSGGAPISFVLIFVALALCAGLAATAIDHVRIHTGWHPVIKVFAYLAALVGAFGLFAAVVFVLEYFNI